MALRPVPRDQVPAAYRDKIDASIALMGDARLLQILANAPHIASWFFDSFYEQIFFGGIVPIRIKELVRLRLSQLHGCAS